MVVARFLDNFVVTCDFRALFLDTLSAAFLGLTALTRLPGPDRASLLDGVGHHFLLLEALSDVVAVQAQVALLAEAEQHLGEEAAAHDGGYGQDNQEVWPVLHPFRR